ncbi:hypothetical protein ACFPM7_11095 [Actinokineospora guangxiensis]|uniref:Uncharacterized protein n=1 Tax=Actinokineospora guangxiensis TaxID=1490288 RepID=A0ABW0EN80_9PSEU
MVSEFETRKDTVQELTESAADHVGRIAQIIAGAVRDIAREVGDWATDVIEMNEASRRARADDRAPDAPVVVNDTP